MNKPKNVLLWLGYSVNNRRLQEAVSNWLERKPCRKMPFLRAFQVREGLVIDWPATWDNFDLAEQEWLDQQPQEWMYPCEIKLDETIAEVEPIGES